MVEIVVWEWRVVKIVRVGLGSSKDSEGESEGW